jgi:hypothetical protein
LQFQVDEEFGRFFRYFGQRLGYCVERFSSGGQLFGARPCSRDDQQVQWQRHVYSRREGTSRPTATAGITAAPATAGIATAPATAGITTALATAGITTALATAGITTALATAGITTTGANHGQQFGWPYYGDPKCRVNGRH